ncbi:phage portal protein [Mycobacteroides abscessus]|uniref:phage portal protein n=1 Tax=Mycobacteroides abscessus TaxID=36809 RepID=UPI000C26B66F|nr:phage portal protein [Mycobacteroides abscessus]MDO3023431.1 phage portal protein [Mycobacteroides abscessus subsp. abscessus]PVB51157.1 phage portal protein [Mycobacteroides abscessus]RIR80153.1 phage portal protein [Mycobacteroides abscessus]RIT30003.1 phage portal protein [Mycobacteroides abscessus]RIT38031.1 phage portal protein [Mycobacteroides abscessus]
MGFVVSAGQVQRLGRLDSPKPARLAIGGLSQDYLQIWRKHYAVRTTVSYLARNIAQLGLHVYRRHGDNERERLTNHPLAQLIRQPNGWTTRYRMLEALVHDLGIFDASYLRKVNTEHGLGLIRLDPLRVLPKGDNWFYPEVFELRGSKGTVRIPADEVVFFRGYNGGSSDVGGVPPIEALREVLEESHNASVMRSQVLRNGARTSGYIERPPGAKWSDEAKIGFKSEWQAQYAGDGPQAGGTPILEDGMKFVEANQTPKDLQYIEARKLTREEVAAAYYVPPPMLGLLDNATFSNITEQHRMLYQDTLGPWLSMICDEIALQLVPDMIDSSDLYVEFNLDEKLRGNFEQRQEAIAKSTGAPWRTRNEARALENLPPIEGGDELVQPLNVTQNGDDEPTPAQADPMVTPRPVEATGTDESED